MTISTLLRAAPLAACVLLAGCDDSGLASGLPFLNGAHWRLVEDQDRLTGQTQSHAELTANLDGGGQVKLEARCAGGPGPATALRVSGEISAIGPRKALDQVSQWRAAAGGHEGDIAVALTGEDGFSISVAATPTATTAPDDLSTALLSPNQALRVEVAREGDDPVLNFRNTDDAFQAMVRRCRLHAEQGGGQTQQAGPAPLPLVGGPDATPSLAAPAQAAPTRAVDTPSSRRMSVAPSNPNGGPAPLPPHTGQIAPLPPSNRR